MRGTQFVELSAFVAVAEHRNFTKAAVHLGISPSSLSQTIRSFEERLGVRLFNRTTRSVALTEVGERLLADAQPVLDGIDKAIEGVNSFRDKPIGMLRLSMPRAVAVIAVGPLLRKFLAAFPEIKVEVNVDDTHSDIVAGRFDAGIRIGERIEKDMVAIRLLDKFRRMAVASPSYLALHPAPVTPEDLHAHNCVRLRWDWDDSIQPWVFENAGRRLEIPVSGSLILNDMHLLLNAVLDGIGIGYFGEPIISTPVADGQLVPLLEDWCAHFSGIYLYYPSRRQMPGPLRAFIDFMRSQSHFLEAARVGSGQRSQHDRAARPGAMTVTS
ncbi:MAG: LysR family transcriptional regulator [Bradyrhizobiaceae bacterium]|nr:LysR family transcriptional regulator [Bradyrhizobiaceae bacterium]